MIRAAAVGFALGLVLPLLGVLSHNRALEALGSPGMYVAVWLPIENLVFIWVLPAVMLSANGVVFGALAAAGWWLSKRFVAHSNPA